MNSSKSKAVVPGVSSTGPGRFGDLAGTCSEDITLQRACIRIQRRKEAECMSLQR